MRLKRPNCFFSTKFGIISCYSNKGVQEKQRPRKYGHFSVLKVCLSKVHSIDFHDKKIKSMLLQIEIYREETNCSYLFLNNEW